MKFLFNFVKNKQKQDFLYKVSKYKGIDLSLIIIIHMIKKPLLNDNC